MYYVNQCDTPYINRVDVEINMLSGSNRYEESVCQNWHAATVETAGDARSRTFLTLKMDLF